MDFGSVRVRGSKRPILFVFSRGIGEALGLPGCPQLKTSMNPNLHESDPNLHEMAPKTTMDRPNGHHCVQAPKRVAFSHFSMNQSTVKLGQGVNGAVPRMLGTSMKVRKP